MVLVVAGSTDAVSTNTTVVSLMLVPLVLILLAFIPLVLFPLAVHCKKELAIFPSPAGMSLTKLSLGGKKLNYSRSGRV